MKTQKTQYIEKNEKKSLYIDIKVKKNRIWEIKNIFRKKRKRKKLYKIIRNGYKLVYKPKHSLAQKTTGFVLLHRLIMSSKLKRNLKVDEIVHHIDENKKNNNINNLEILNHKTHRIKHAIISNRKKLNFKKPIIKETKCKICGNKLPKNILYHKCHTCRVNKHIKIKKRGLRYNIQ